MFVTVVVLIAILANSVRLMTTNLDKQVNQQIEEIRLAYHSALMTPLIDQDAATLRDMLDSWVKAGNIDFMIVTDESSNILYGVGESQNGALPTPGEYATQRVELLPVELEGQNYGYLYFGLSTHYIRSALIGLLVQNSTIAIFGIIALSIMLGFVIFYFTRNVEKVALSSIKISQGHFEERIEVEGNDEIAILSRNFNAMASTIQDHINTLRKKEQRFRAIADYTYSWENWFNSGGLLQWINPAVERITGYTPDECMKMENFPLPLVHPNDLMLVRRQIEQARSGFSGQDLEYRIHHKNGHDVWVAVSWQGIFDENGLSLGYRSSVRDVTLQHVATEELTYQAEHDSLTGLHNRRAFERRLKQVLDWQKQDQRPIAVFYLDLDQFKVVNDSCGHIAGDQLLIGISRLLEGYTPYGFFARLGGDEFGILFRDLDKKDAMSRANACLEAIRNYEFSFSGRTFNVSASIGVVQCSENINSVSKILIAADTACYAAKELGRNQVVYYDDNDDYFRMRSEEFSSVSHINTALAQGRFLLYFQRVEPLQNDANTYRHAEVLLRLRDISGNIQSPERFINAAERFNLMPYIDRWVVDSVCRQLSKWNSQQITYDVYRFAINVSGASLSDRDFPDFVAERISKYNIDPQRLCFEITESHAVAQINLALSFIERMHDLKAYIALDDFGSGLSSFAYLKQFKVDYLKIDGQFVKNLDTDNSDRAVVESMVQLAAAYGLRTVAEYVCNNDIYKIVKDLGVTYAQGYACHVPEPLTNLVEDAA